MQTRIGVLVVMLDKGKSFQDASRPLNELQDTDEYKIIFGDKITHKNTQTYLQDQPVEILFDRYPYQTYTQQDPLQKRSFLDTQDKCVPICNPRVFTELCKDKWEFQKYMLKNNIPMPPISQNRYQYWIKKWGGIAVAKFHTLP